MVVVVGLIVVRLVTLSAIASPDTVSGLDRRPDSVRAADPGHPERLHRSIHAALGGLGQVAANQGGQSPLAIQASGGHPDRWSMQVPDLVDDLGVAGRTGGRLAGPPGPHGDVLVAEAGVPPDVLVDPDHFQVGRTGQGR